MAIRTGRLILACAAALSSSALWAQLPDGPGRDATMDVCGKCHDVGVVTGYHLTKQGWTDIISQMIEKGAEGTDAQLNAVLEYLTKNFGPAAAAHINVNKAAAKDLETQIGLTADEAAAIVKYRGDNGEFKELDDLKKVPNLDFKKIEAKKDRIVFHD